MSATTIVTRNVSGRMRGFLASSMLELTAGVYIAPKMNHAVRERIWLVVQEWFIAETDASVVMLWPDSAMPGGQAVRVLGAPRIQLAEIDGLLITHRPA